MNAAADAEDKTEKAPITPEPIVSVPHPCPLR
jgi:hypothetical protein